MPRYLLLEAALQPGTDHPFLVVDPAEHRRYIGVQETACAKPPTGSGVRCGCAHRGEHFEPARAVALADSFLRREADAGLLIIHLEIDAPSLTAAQAAAGV